MNQEAVLSVKVMRIGDLMHQNTNIDRQGMAAQIIVPLGKSN